MAQYASMNIIIMDERSHLPKPREVQVFKNIPYNWTARLIREHFGIADHFTVYQSFDDEEPKLLSRAQP